LLAQVVVVAGLVAMFVFRESIEAQGRVLVALATTIETPVVTWAVEELTKEPRVGERVVAGTPTVVVRPADGERWPAVVFVNGATEQGRHHPEVQRFARGLARAGYLVAVPELPGLREGEVTERTHRVTVAVAQEIAERPDVRDGRVGFVGVSVGATLALLAASEPELAGRTTVVSGIAPYTDLENTVRLATTGYYRDGDLLIAYETGPFLALVVARSLAAALPAGEDRDAVLGGLRALADDTAEPLAPPSGYDIASLGPEARALVELLLNRDPLRFDELYARLSPELRETVARLSPLRTAEELAAPVELATAPEDEYFPPAESRALVQRAPDARLTVTRALAHAEPEPTPRLLRDFLRFNGFAVRTLRAAGG
jgi:pimeloyl-ACP methyl ester carboxylesterase